MTEPDMTSHDDGDDCMAALAQVHAFLNSELVEIDADSIRYHLHACEGCMQDFEIEATITAMIQRCEPAPAVPQALLRRVTKLRVRRTEAN